MVRSLVGEIQCYRKDLFSSLTWLESKQTRYSAIDLFSSLTWLESKQTRYSAIDLFSSLTWLESKQTRYSAIERTYLVVSHG